LNKTHIFLDTKTVTAANGDRLYFEDKLTSYAASAASFCVNSRLPASFRHGPLDSDFSDISNPAELELLLRKLAELEFCGESFLSESLKVFFREEDFFNLVVFLFDISDELFETISDLSSMGHNVIIYYVFGETSEPDAMLENRISVLTAQGVTVEMVCLSV
jgi:hypothetical protein